MPIDPAAAALLAFGGGLAQMAGPSREPIGLGQGLGAGVQSGLGAYMAAQDMARQERMAEMEMLEYALKAQQYGQAQQQQARQQDAIARMLEGAPPEEEPFAAAFPELYAQAAIGQQFAKPTKPEIFGSAETGYYTLGDEGAQQLIKGVGRAPPAEPEEIRAMRAMGLNPADQQDQLRYYALKRTGTEPLVEVFDPGTGQVTYAPRAEAAGKMPPPDKGMRISYDEEGRPIVETGVTAGGGMLQKPTATEIEKEMLADTASMQRLQSIEQSWRPEYNEILPRAGMRWAEIKDKFGQLGTGEQQALQDFAAARQDSIANLNRTIKEITGAAMSIPEAERITKEMPNPGTAIFDGDAPTVFKSKLDNAIKKIRLSYARKAYIRTKGFPPTPDFGGISLEQMPQIIDQRGAELESQLASQGLPPDQVMQQVAQQLKAEFGL